MIPEPEDEGLHPARTEDTWQENYLFTVLDPQRRAGCYLHVGRQHALGQCIVKVVAFTEGAMVSTRVTTPLTDLLESPGLSLDVLEPLVRWRVRWEGLAAPAVAGFHCSRAGGDVPVSFDIELDADLPPVQNDYGADERDPSITTGKHYEQGLRAVGELRVGDVVVALDGLAIRDHTWGTRRLVGVDRVWWTPATVLGPAPRFVRATDVLQGEARTSRAMVMGADAEVDVLVRVDVLPDDLTTDGPLSAWLELTGGAAPLRVRVEGVARLPMVYLEGWGERAILSDETFGVATFPDGATGMAVLEWNRPLDAARVAELRAALG